MCVYVYMCVYIHIHIYIVNILKVLKCFLKKDGEDQLDRSCEKCRIAEGRRGKEHQHSIKRWKSLVTSHLRTAF